VRICLCGTVVVKGILSIPRTTEKFVCNTGDLIPGRHGKKTHVLGENLPRYNVSVTKPTCQAL
jgi:hypothetical protein